MSGTTGSTSVRPTDLKAVRDAVLDTAGPIAIAGAGTAADWAGDLDPVDTVLDTTGLTGVITHNPGDMTVAVRAGTPLRALQDELSPHGQHVSFDAARVADGATVGGLVATADAGPAALVFGSLRDLVIGVTIVLADGSVARGGGHVIKNVAGYDLAKVLHGSYGAFGVLAEVVLRLHPVPRASTTIALPCPLEGAGERAARILGGPYEPAALEWVSDDGGRLLVRLEGTRDALPARAERIRELLGPEAADTPDDVWERHAGLVRGSAEGAVLRIGARPSRLPDLLSRLRWRTATAGLGSGAATVELPVDAVVEAHGLVHEAGGTSVLRRRPDGAGLPGWGPPLSALAVLTALKRELDPEGRFGPGRFSPWIQGAP
ncbi:FAD-binding oxidoreductase [Pseudonocardia humida]|uniref:FAD-binding protein n=1 Tax=Pseudonocardia humida TaxID=2800819 RepID=A0ABT0ZUA8_9PSEU|nr:FAD-binding protein [Pseudonocardia humida]MCO1654308.1 FAD-binding protein [Pseudonocardia humida]